MTKLTAEQVESSLSGLPEWTEVSGEIQRTYQFDDFAASMRFVNAVAAAAEKANHHPDILIRYNKVTLTLTTHDAGGITELDFELAQIADSLA